MAVARLESERYPYLPLAISAGERIIHVDAVLDTGFDGDIVPPVRAFADNLPPDDYRTWELADDSVVAPPVFCGSVQLDSFAPVEADVVLLGDEPIVGRGISDRYRVILEHGERVIVEP